MAGYKTTGGVLNVDTEYEAAEDAAHTSADKGIMALAVRKDTAAALAGTDADYAPLEVDATGNLWVRQGAGAALALKASGAQTDSTNGTGVVCGQYRRFAILLDITALATAVDDTLDVFIDVSPDGGTTWINAVHFDQVLGNGSAEKQWAVLDAAAPGTSVVDVTSDAAEEAVRPYLFGSHIRYRSTIVDAGDDNASFTYSVTAYAQ